MPSTIVYSRAQSTPRLIRRCRLVEIRRLTTGRIVALSALRVQLNMVAVAANSMRYQAFNTLAAI
jgi:hypothetical protein